MAQQSIKILMADDDPDDVLLTREMLKEAKVLLDLDSVSNGAEALAYLRKEGAYANCPTPDLILLDINMPVLDGHAALKAIKADPRFRAIPVIVLTTSSSDQEVSKTYHEGANCYVTKPVGLDQLAKVVGSIEQFWLTVVKLPPRAP